MHPRAGGSWKPPRGARPDWSHPLARGLRCALLFNENGGPPFDVVGRNAATMNNFAAAPWGRGPWGSHLTFDSTDDYITLPASQQYDVDESAAGFSVVAYLERNENDQETAILHKKSTAGVADTQADIIFAIAESGRFASNGNDDVVFGFGDGTAARTHDSSTTVPSIGDPDLLHLVGVFDRSLQRIKIYIDGVEDIDEAETNTPASNGYQPVIGAHFNGSGTRDQDLGSNLIHLYMYDRPLRASEVTWLYRSPYEMFVA